MKINATKTELVCFAVLALTIGFIMGINFQGARDKEDAIAHHAAHHNAANGAFEWLEYQPPKPEPTRSHGYMILSNGTSVDLK